MGTHLSLHPSLLPYTSSAVYKPRADRKIQRPLRVLLAALQTTLSPEAHGLARVLQILHQHVAGASRTSQRHHQRASPPPPRIVGEGPRWRRRRALAVLRDGHGLHLGVLLRPGAVRRVHPTEALPRALAVYVRKTFLTPGS